MCCGREPVGSAVKIERRLQGNSRGISTLEFIAVLPFLLFIMLVVVEATRLVATFNVLVQASREGARTGAVTSPWSGDASQRCDTFPTNPPLRRACAVAIGLPSIDPATTTVTASCSGTTCAASQDSRVTVTVSTNFRTLFPNYWWMPSAWTSGMLLRHASIMRYE